MRGWVSNLKVWTSSSTRSTPRRVAVWGSGSPSVAPLSRVIRAVSGPHRMMVREPRLHFSSPQTRGCDGRPQSWRHADACGDGCGADHEGFVMVIRSLVSVVDDDESVRESLPDLLRECGFAVQAFSSAEAFLASEYVGQTSCLLLDIAMPGMSGPDLQRELTRRRHEMPIVFITALGEETVRPYVLAQGAVACLFKPFSETALLEALQAALRGR